MSYPTTLKPFPRKNRTVEFYIEAGMKDNPGYKEVVEKHPEGQVGIQQEARELSFLVLEYNDEYGKEVEAKTKDIQGVNPIYILGYEWVDHYLNSNVNYEVMRRRYGDLVF